MRMKVSAKASRLSGRVFADTEELVLEVVAACRVAPLVGVDTETVGVDASKQHVTKGHSRAISIQLATKDFSAFIPLWGGREGLLMLLKPFLENDRKCKVLHNAKYDMHILANHGIEMRGLLADTMVMDYVYNTAEFHSLKECIHRYFGEDTKEYGETFRRPKLKKNGQPGKQMYTPSLNEVIETQEGIDKLYDYAVKDPEYTIRLFTFLQEKLVKENWYGNKTMLDYYNEVELPFTLTLLAIEKRGAPVDVEQLGMLKTVMSDDLVELRSRLVSKCIELGVPAAFMEDFNPGSPKQVGKLFEGYFDWVFEDRTPTGQPQTNDASLSKIRGKAAPIASMLLALRSVEKLLGTYAEPFLELQASYGGNIHTSFKQLGTECMPAGELVLTSRGYIPVEEVRIGDNVLTHKHRIRKVLLAGENGTKPIYTVTLSNGLSLRTTGNHPYLCEDKWVRADRLTIGARVCVHAREQEYWRKIQGWGDWSVSSWGRVRNDKTDRIATQRVQSKWGHMAVCLYRNGCQKRGPDRKDFRVHRLVAAAFSVPGEGPEVRHLNGVEFDNSVTNLMYGTRTENARDAQGHGTLVQTRKLSDEDVQRIRSTSYVRGDGRVGRTSSDQLLADELGVCREMVGQVRRGDRKVERELVQPYWHHAEVVSVTLSKSEMTYGLTIEEDHSHVTGGIVTHNTGRLSSSAPNLQNLPKSSKDEYGIRTCFRASDGFILGDIDLSTVEMRVAAHLSGDERLVDAINRGLDLHSLTAAYLFSEPRAFVGAKTITPELLDEVKKRFPDARSKAKTINFGVLYGMGPRRYAEQTGLSEHEGRDAINKFYATYPGLKTWMGRVERLCASRGYVKTIFGRRIHIPEILSNDPGTRAYGKRCSVNYSIQGSVADMMKVAMNLIENDPKLKVLGVRTILQIHDELILEIPIAVKDEVQSTIESYVSHPYRSLGFKNLLVDTPAELGFGANWEEAKG